MRLEKGDENVKGENDQTNRKQDRSHTKPPTDKQKSKRSEKQERNEKMLINNKEYFDILENIKERIKPLSTKRF